jgi:quinol monooxygenase YgiN
MELMMLQMRVAPGKRHELLRTLTAILGPVGVMPGCRSCRLYQDAQDDYSMLLVTEWASKHDWDEFLTTREFRTLLIATDLLREKPEVRLLSQSEGQDISLIREAWQEVT